LPTPAEEKNGRVRSATLVSRTKTRPSGATVTPVRCAGAMLTRTRGERRPNSRRVGQARAQDLLSRPSEPCHGQHSTNIGASSASHEPIYDPKARNTQCDPVSVPGSVQATDEWQLVERGLCRPRAAGASQKAPHLAKVLTNESKVAVDHAGGGRGVSDAKGDGGRPSGGAIELLHVNRDRGSHRGGTDGGVAPRSHGHARGGADRATDEGGHSRR